MPVYLWRRTKALGQSLSYFIVGIVFWVLIPCLGFALSLASLRPVDEWLGRRVNPPAATTETVSAVAPSRIVREPVPIPTPQATALAAVDDTSAPTDPVFANVSGMVVAAKFSNWQAVDKRHAALYQLAPPQRGDQEASKQANKEGLAAITANNTEDAVQAFARSLAADPANVEARNNLAYAHMLAGHFEDAERGLIETLGTAPDRASAWANLSDLTARQGHRDASLACLRLTVRYSKDRAKVLSYLGKAADENSNQLYRQVASEVLKEFDAIPPYVPQ